MQWIEAKRCLFKGTVSYPVASMCNAMHIFEECDVETLWDAHQISFIFSDDADYKLFLKHCRDENNWQVFALLHLETVIEAAEKAQEWVESNRKRFSGSISFPRVLGLKDSYCFATEYFNPEIPSCDDRLLFTFSDKCDMDIFVGQFEEELNCVLFAKLPTE